MNRFIQIKFMQYFILRNWDNQFQISPLFYMNISPIQHGTLHICNHLAKSILQKKCHFFPFLKWLCSLFFGTVLILLDLFTVNVLYLYGNGNSFWFQNWNALRLQHIWLLACAQFGSKLSNFNRCFIRV